MKQQGPQERGEANPPQPFEEAWRAVLLLLCALFLGGCLRSKETTIQADLTQYLAQARLWAETETEINTAIATVRQDQFVHDDLVVETLKPAIRMTQAHVQELERYQPQTPALYNVHREYTEAWRAHSVALAAIVNAVEQQDYIRLAAAKNNLLEARDFVAGALADLARLLEEAGMRSPPAPEREKS